MKYFKTRTAFLTGIAFGIFFTLSCATVDKTEAPTESGSVSNSFDERLSYLNQRIRSNPRNEEVRIQKAEVLYEYAISRLNPEERKPIYQNLRIAADDSQTLPNARTKINDVLKKAWNTEQGSGIRLLQEDWSETYETHFNHIIAHLNNAIIIIPDSLITYSLKSTTLYRRGHIIEAIGTLVTANQISNGTNTGIREKLAYLYSESGDHNEAISLYSELTQEYPSRDYYRYGLINTLIINKQHDDAVMILKNLAGQYPARVNYRESLATELFYIFSNKADLLSGNPPAAGALQNDLNETLGILEEARTLFDELNSQIPSNEENTFRMGTFYMNASHKLHELSKLGVGEEVEDELLKKSNEYMEAALPFWERIAEITTENMEYLNILRSVYLELGMNEEADSIERTFNF